MFVNKLTKQELKKLESVFTKIQRNKKEYPLFPTHI